MVTRAVNRQVTVGGGSTEVFQCRAEKLVILTLRTTKDVEWAYQPLNGSDGVYLYENEATTITKDDLRGISPGTMFEVHMLKAGVDDSTVQVAALVEV